MTQLKLAHPIIHIQINQRMLKHHLMNHMAIKILKLKSLKQLIIRLADELFDIQYIIQSLNHLTLDTTSPLERVYSIDILGNEIHGFNLLQIKKLVPQPKHPSWIDAEFGRKLLFLKLELKDQHDQYYLIDIHKNKSHEAFCAFIIVSPHKLTREQIKIYV